MLFNFGSNQLHLIVNGNYIIPNPKVNGFPTCYLIQFMKKEKMTEIVNVELEHIPTGDLPQKLLRFVYNMVRRNDLSVSENTPREETLLESINRVKEKHSNFQPKYDKNFFNF